MDPPPSVSVVIPVLNERLALPALLRSLHDVEGILELIFVDGGSTDGTVAWLRDQGCWVMEAARGRGTQLAAGAKAASGNILWFLHADSKAPSRAARAIQQAVNQEHAAGAFCLHFEGCGVTERGMTWLYRGLRKAGLVYGDAGIFVRRDAYMAVGGLPEWPLFEDQGLLRRLRKAGFPRPVCLDLTLTTSSRRFAGWRFPLVFTHWVGLQVLFWIGVPPQWLARSYTQPRIAG
ncbi:MAG: TIGR04283 family arsenosugar biosynthesis glycosyltransferase [Bryobacterales bacterium]|nr:TIGR04283 family arsenosugar biosynthesis glycosyltransferase [Bryobacterales bacterium]